MYEGLIDRAHEAVRFSVHNVARLHIQYLEHRYPMELFAILLLSALSAHINLTKHRVVDSTYVLLKEAINRL